MSSPDRRSTGSPPLDEGGDVDIRGFHVADAKEFTDLETPEEQIQVNQGTVTEGFEFCEGYELVSYELRKFGKLLWKTNFNVLEWIYCGHVLVNGPALLMDQLRDMMSRHLPADVPEHYIAMAEQNYHKHLRGGKESYRPTAKKHLYVLRGLLAAIYTGATGKIEADIRKLARYCEDHDDRAC